MVRSHRGGPEEGRWFVHMEVALKRAVGTEEGRWFVHIEVALQRAVGSFT